jgi:hypothetical protein
MSYVELGSERRTRGQVFGVPNEMSVLRVINAKANAMRRMGDGRRRQKTSAGRTGRSAWAA